MKKTLQFYFLLAALAASAFLAFLIFGPFLYALVLAVVFAVVFQPIHQRMLGRMRRWPSLAALATTVVVIIVIVAPLFFLGFQLFQEARELYDSVTAGSQKDTLFTFANNAVQEFRRYFPGGTEFSFNTDQYLKQGFTILFQRLGGIFSSFAKIAASSFIFLIALYYLLKDGQKIKARLVELSPLSNEDDEIIFAKLGRAINSVVRGTLLVALIQGILTTIGFLIFGVPNATLWGSFAAIAALIPGIGTALVLTPAILFLFLAGHTASATGLLVWGICAVGLIDNLLGPKLMGHGMRLHPLVMLLSVLGGLAFFGPIGFLLGPLAISLFFALFDIYASFMKEEHGFSAQ